MRSIDGEVESSSGSRSGCPSYNLSVTFGDSSPSRGASGGAEKFPMEDEALRNASASPFGRGVTEGDGEGKPGEKVAQHGDKQRLCQGDAIAKRTVFLSAALPSQALRASSPRGRALGEGKRHLYNQKSPRHDAERAGGFSYKAEGCGNSPPWGLVI